jgi:hypothetical protein
MPGIPADYADLFDKPSFAFVASLLSYGSPHVTPTWVDRDGDTVLVNTVQNNRKDRNVAADPRVSLAIADPENPYRYLGSAASWSSGGPRAPANTSTPSRSGTPASHGTPGRAATASFT